MKKALEFANRHMPTLVVTVLVTAAAAFFKHYWSDPAKAQSAGGFLAFVAAAILIGVTWEYVRINQKALSLQQLQWEQQNRVVLRFGIKRYNGKAQLWIANIGKTDFLVSELLVRIKDSDNIASKQRRVVAAGSRETLRLPEKLWTEKSLISTFDVRFRYESQHDSGLSAARAFTLVIGLSRDVIKIRQGIDDMWFLPCPKCGQLAGSMITEELDNFDEAAKRQAVMESELRATCPDHQSQWMDSVEQIRRRRAESDPEARIED
jgi:hypothetical protein